MSTIVLLTPLLCARNDYIYNKSLPLTGIEAVTFCSRDLHYNLGT